MLVPALTCRQILQSFLNLKGIEGGKHFFIINVSYFETVRNSLTAVDLWADINFFVQNINRTSFPYDELSLVHDRLGLYNCSVRLD